MFTATIIACFAGLAPVPTCMSITDKRGPYETRAECDMRLMEMARIIPAITPGKLLGMEGKCVTPPSKKEIGT